jgi:putative membrane protein
VLPVGSRALADELLARIVPDALTDRLPPPRRARVKSPLLYRFLSYGQTDTCVVTTTGRIRRVTAWVPLAKVQSFRRVQGPVQRRLGLASIHLDTAGRSVHANLRDRDVDEADTALESLVALARAARRSQ